MIHTGNKVRHREHFLFDLIPSHSELRIKSFSYESQVLANLYISDHVDAFVHLQTVTSEEYTEVKIHDEGPVHGDKCFNVFYRVWSTVLLVS